MIENIIKLRSKQAETMGSRSLFAEDAMISPSLVCSEASSDKVLQLLKKKHINTCIVVNREKKLLGKINERDIIKLFLEQVKNEPIVRILNRGYRRKFSYLCAKDIMKKNKKSVNKKTPINNVIEIIQKEDFDYIPVLDDEKVAGVITPSSLINLLKNY